MLTPMLDPKHLNPYKNRHIYTPAGVTDKSKARSWFNRDRAFLFYMRDELVQSSNVKQESYKSHSDLSFAISERSSKDHEIILPGSLKIKRKSPVLQGFFLFIIAIYFRSIKSFTFRVWCVSRRVCIIHLVASSILFFIPFV